MEEALDAIVFYVTGGLAVLSAIIVVTRRNPVYSAVFMVNFFVMVAVQFLVLRAPFLAIIQLLVYGGAIMVLYLFVIMLLNLKPSEIREEVTPRRRLFALSSSFGLYLLLAWAIRTSAKVQGAPALTGPLPESQRDIEAGSLDAIAEELFREHGFVFELTSILILIAIIGAIYLTKKAGWTHRDGHQDGHQPG
jgi:NADH-quinone oxidoreductase subunit J